MTTQDHQYNTSQSENDTDKYTLLLGGLVQQECTAAAYINDKVSIQMNQA